jgi:peptidyl-prolyl cis-trans isomerase B (cyclophilin B)
MLRAAMLRRLTPLLLLLAALALLAGCGGSKKKTTSSASTSASTATTDTSTTSTTQQNGPCKTVAQPAPKGPQHLPKPTLKLDPSKTWTVTMATNCGSFTIALDVKHAPRTSASFASLTKQGFFDQLTFHRIVPGFVIQGGDPQGDGSGGPGYTVVEPPPSNVQYTHGVVAMAKTGNEPSGASGSQFFVMLADNQLPPEYALLGKVTKGLGVVDAIGKVALQSNDPQGAAPVDPVVIESAKLQSR